MIGLGTLCHKMQLLIICYSLMLLHFIFMLTANSSYAQKYAKYLCTEPNMCDINDKDVSMSVKVYTGKAVKKHGLQMLMRVGQLEFSVLLTRVAFVTFDPGICDL